MGYYTWFEISMREAKDAKVKLQDCIKDIFNELSILIYDEELPTEEMDRYLDDFNKWGGTNFFDSELKWYEWDSDMAALSTKFPDVYFVINGRGEDYDDRWRAYVHNGSVHQYQAEFYYGDENAAAEFDDKTEGPEYYI